MNRNLGVTAALAASLLVAGCAGEGGSEGPVRGGSADYPVYESVADLVKQTDATVEVKVGGVASKEYDNGGDGSDDKGVPMVFWNAEVVEVLEPGSNLEPGQTIVIGWPDLEVMPMEGRSALKSGQTVVAFVVRRTPVDAPGIDTQAVFYIPLGGDNGVMDVDTDRATARSELLTRLAARPGNGQGASRLSVALSDLGSAVAAEHRKHS